MFKGPLGTSRRVNDPNPRQAAAHTYIRQRRPFLFNTTHEGVEYGVMAFPLEAAVQTLGLAPLQLEGYGFIFRDVKAHGDWTKLDLFRFSNPASFNLEAAHLLRGELVSLYIGAQFAEEHGMISLVPPMEDTFIALPSRKTRRDFVERVCEEFEVTIGLLEWSNIHIFEVVAEEA